MNLKIIAAVTTVIFTSSLTGCANVKGAMQKISVNTDPAGADCLLVRQGQVIARVPQTPGYVTIRKTRDDIMIRCDKAGYQTATYLNHSELAASIFAMLLLGGARGVASQVAAGDGSRYDGTVNMTLTPGEPMEAFPLPPSLQPLHLPPLPPLPYAAPMY